MRDTAGMKGYQLTNRQEGEREARTLKTFIKLLNLNERDEHEPFTTLQWKCADEGNLSAFMLFAIYSHCVHISFGIALTERVSFT